MTYAVEFQNVSRLYGDVRAVDGVSIGIRDGEFFSMLGPSGSGKTTCLRLIAGFEQLSGGTIHIFGQPASELPPPAAGCEYRVPRTTRYFPTCRSLTTSLTA